MLAWIMLIPSLITAGLEIFKAVRAVEKEVKGSGNGKAKKEIVMNCVDFAYSAAKGINAGNPAPAASIFQKVDGLIDCFVKVLNVSGDFKTPVKGK